MIRAVLLSVSLSAHYLTARRAISSTMGWRNTYHRRFMDNCAARAALYAMTLFLLRQ